MNINEALDILEQRFPLTVMVEQRNASYKFTGILSGDPRNRKTVWRIWVDGPEPGTDRHWYGPTLQEVLDQCLRETEDNNTMSQMAQNAQECAQEEHA